MLDPKKFLIQKNFGSKKIWGTEKCLVPKNFGSQKFGVKKHLVLKMLVPDKFWFSKKSFWLVKILGFKIWVPKISDPKKFQQYPNKVGCQVGPEYGKPNLNQTKPNCHEHQGLSNYHEVRLSANF